MKPTANTGRLASVTNPLGKKTYYLYNARGQVTHTWGDVPQPVVYGYDAYGQRTTLTTFRDDGLDWTAAEWPSEPPDGDTTTWTYDEATGVVTAKRYADDKGPDYDYTADGRLSQRTWARQVGWPPEPLTTDYSYDAASGELTGIDYSDATPDVSFTYTRTGAPATVIDVVGTRTFGYNDALQLESESTSGLYSRVISRAYETSQGGGLPGRYNKLMVGTSQDQDADYESTYGYDSSGRLNRVTGPGLPAYGAVYSFAAYSDLVSQIAYKSDSSTTVASTIRGFEGTRDLITSIENKWGATSVSKYEYTNDGLGRRNSVTVSGSAFNTTGTTGFDLFTYNDRNELASAKRYTGGTLENPSNPVYTRHFGYDYDPIGNRERYQIGQGTATTYTANQLNQYTATADPSESFTHDDDGNLTQDGTYTYVWDAENRLIEAYPTNPTTGSQKCVMTYDYMNRRVQRSLYNWTGSAWAGTYSSSRIFVYDGWNNLIAYNPAGGLSIHRKNTWGLDLSGLNGNAAPGGIHGAGGIGGLIGSTVANALPPPSYICFYDANGNLGETIKNSDGTLWSHHEYDPWGKQLVKYETAGMAHPFRYSTKYSDGLFEKYYFGYRYDHYFLGRFITRDLIAELGGANLYVFVKNAPTQLIDADGLMPGGRLPIRQPPPQVQPPLPPPTDPPPPPPPTSGPASVWVPCPPQPFDVINQHVRVPCFTPPPEFRPAAYAMCCDGQCGAWLRSRPSDDAVFYCRVAHECDHCVDAQVNYGLNCENQPDGNKVYGGPIRIDPGSVGGGGTQPPIPEECTAYTEQVRCLLEHCDTPWSRSPCASELCTMLCRRSYHCQQGGSWSDEDRRWCEMMCSLIFGNRE